MRSTRPRRLRSTLVASVTLLAVAAGASACGDDSSDDDADDTRSESTSDTSGTLSADQVDEAVISLDNLGDGWTEEDVDPDDEDEDGPGCFGEIGRITEDVDPEEKAERKYGYGDQGMPQLNTKISSFDDPDLVADLFDQVEKAAEACTSIDYTEGEWTYDLDMRTLTDLPLDDIDIDDQFSFVASGTLTSGSQTADMYLYYTMVRVGPTVASIATTGLEDVASEQQELVKVGAARLAAVAGGKTPESTVIPAT